MAKHIAFAEPVNDAERWAFSLLAAELPEHYQLLTNLEIPTPQGHLMEVDALVIGDWGVYVVDVKGYIGELQVGINAWQLDGRNVDNSLAKANYVARVLAGKLKHKVPVGVYAPWCQGMVLVTGRKGSEILVEKETGQLSVYTPTMIVEALTQPWGSTSQYRHQVSPSQRDAVIDVLGQVAWVEQRNNRIQDFEKQRCLFMHQGLEVWQAKYTLGQWQSPWLLKILTPTAFDDEQSYHQARLELEHNFTVLTQLVGCSGAPYVAPLIQTGEHEVLAIAMPRGTALNQLSLAEITPLRALHILRNAVAALSQIHRRGFAVGGWQDQTVFINDVDDVEFLDIRPEAKVEDDITLFAKLFLPMAQHCAQPRVSCWFVEAAAGKRRDLDVIRNDLSAVLQHLSVEAKGDTPAQRLEQYYQLSTLLSQSEHVELWQGVHLQGRYPVAVSIYHQIQAHWPALLSIFDSLALLHHPSIEQVIDFGRFDDSGAVYISRSWYHGLPLHRQQSTSPAQTRLWFVQLLSALQYVHRLDIYHGGICPYNIICSPERAVLVNFALGEAIARTHYAAMLADDSLWQLQSPAEKDLFGLVVSFVERVAAEHGVSFANIDKARAFLTAANNPLDPRIAKVALDALNFDLQLPRDADYVTLFGFDSDSLFTDEQLVH